MLRRLSRSQLQGSLRRAAKARRSRTSAVSDRRADGKLALSRRHPPLAAVFATRPPPASWAGSPRTRAAPRPEQTADGWPARVGRCWVRLGLGFPRWKRVRVRVSTHALRQVRVTSSPPRLDGGLKNRLKRPSRPKNRALRAQEERESHHRRRNHTPAEPGRKLPSAARQLSRGDAGAREKRGFCQNGGGRPALPLHQTRTARSPREGPQNVDAGGRKSPRFRARARTDPTPPHERPARPATNSRAENRQEMSAAPRIALVRYNHRPPRPSPRALETLCARHRSPSPHVVGQHS